MSMAFGNKIKKEVKFMQRIKYSNKNFDVKSIVSDSFAGVETISIEFENTAFADVQAFFDTQVDKNVLSRFELFEVKQVANEVAEGEQPTITELEELQGIHTGYTKPIDLSCFGGVVKVKIQRELEVEGVVRQQQELIDTLLLGSL